MNSASFRFARARGSRLAGFALSVLLLTALMAVRIGAADASTQASWVPASALDAPDGARRAVNAAVAAGLGAIVAPPSLYIDAGPDRFMELVQLAHEHQLLVYASIDLDRVALAGEVPAARTHVVYQHPEWLMVPRAIAPELIAIDVRSPEYVGRIFRWTRSNGVDGVYLSPVTEEAALSVASMIATVVKRYPVDGVQLEAARYPADDFDYGRRTLDAFRQDIRPALTPPDRTQVDADEAIDPFAYPNAFPEMWRDFRRQHLTGLVGRVRAAIAEARPRVPVAVAVSGSGDSDLQDHLQDWRGWIDRHVVDAVSIRSGATTTIVTDAATLAAMNQAGSSSGSR